MQLAWFHIYSENRCTSHFILLGLYFGKKKRQDKGYNSKGSTQKGKKKQGERKLTYI
jgi:hypothetical protein